MPIHIPPLTIYDTTNYLTLIIRFSKGVFWENWKNVTKPSTFSTSLQIGNFEYAQINPVHLILLPLHVAPKLFRNKKFKLNTCMCVGASVGAEKA